ncbi:MAG: DNA integrity scanning protein DisA [Actinobacteria bacterium]|nr:MAG: DNA integrity scanning protein DisA [Actinomycetota bacterium]
MDDLRFDCIEDALELLAPGMPLREGIDDVIAAHGGAIVVIGDEEKVAPVCGGGFGIGIDFTPQRLFELSKMDGAIVLDGLCSRILRANVHLVPDASIPTSETGMRHRAAERVSKQTGALVVSISRRRAIVSVYVCGTKATLDTIEVALAKADQALQTLLRYRARLDEVGARLLALEFEDLVSFGDVASVIRRFEMTVRVSAEVRRHIVRLGREGRLIRLQADELSQGVADEYVNLLRDYAYDPAADIAEVRAAVAALDGEALLDPDAIAAALGYPSAAKATEEHLHSRGYRLLRRIPMLPAAVMTRLAERFGGVPGLMGATEDQLDDVDGVGMRRARSIAEGLRRLRRNALQ